MDICESPMHPTSPTRREILRRASGGFGSLALSAMLAELAGAADRSPPPVRRSPGAEADAFPAEGEPGDLPLHDGRRLAR